MEGAPGCLVASARARARTGEKSSEAPPQTVEPMRLHPAEPRVDSQGERTVRAGLDAVGAEEASGRGRGEDSGRTRWRRSGRLGASEAAVTGSGPRRSRGGRGSAPGLPASSGLAGRQMTLYDDVMRTIVDLPDEDLRRLTRLARDQGVSRAELIRRAVAAYLGELPEAASRDAFGLWRNRPLDGRAYEDGLREEWNGEAGPRHERPR